MARVTEIAEDVFRICHYLPAFDLQFNQFLVRDEEPFLFHTGMRSLFPDVLAGVAEVIDPATLRWIGFSHFEADECGALSLWQERAPQATAVCSIVAKHVSVDDVVALRPARGLADEEVLTTGKHRLRFLSTPHVPHCWEAGLFLDETTSTLFCSDLFTHAGEVEARTRADVVGRFAEALKKDRHGPFAEAYPYGPRTEEIFARLADLAPRTLAIMHGSTYEGDCRRALSDHVVVLRDIGSSAVR